MARGARRIAIATSLLVLLVASMAHASARPTSEPRAFAPTLREIDHPPVLQHPVTAKQSTGSKFVPIDPRREFDSRKNDHGPMKADTRYTFDLGPNANSNITGVVYNFTVTNVKADSALYVWSGAGQRPENPSSTVRTGETRNIQVTAPLSVDADGVKYIAVEIGAGDFDLTADSEGFYVGDNPTDDQPPGSLYTPVGPKRVLDTRSSASVGAGGTTTFSVASAVPADATAVAMNVVAISPTVTTYGTVWRASTARPAALLIHAPAKQTTPTTIIAAVTAKSPSFSLWNAAGSAHYAVDIWGYYSPKAKNRLQLADQTPLESTTIGAGSSHPFETGQAAAALVNLSAIKPDKTTYLTAWSGAGTRPAVSNLNPLAGQTVNNMVYAPVSGSTFTVWNKQGSTPVRVDKVGLFVPDAG